MPKTFATWSYATAVPVQTAVPEADPLRVQAAEVFAADVAAGRLPSIRAIRSRLRVRQPRAQQVRAYLAALADSRPATGITLEHYLLRDAFGHASLLGAACRGRRPEPLAREETWRAVHGILEDLPGSRRSGCGSC